MQVEVGADDPRLGDYVRLRESSLRRSLESERGLFIAEGEKVIRRAVEAGHRPRSFLLAPRWLAGLEDVLARWPDVDVYVVDEAVAEQVTGFHVHRGALASLHRADLPPVDDLLGLDRLVVLEDVVDHTNVGAILRSAAGLGWDGALLSPRSADPLYRRAVKVSMGAVFALPWTRFPGWRDAPALLTGAGFTTVALTLADDSEDLDLVAERLRGPGKVAVLLGHRGCRACPTTGRRPRPSGSRIPMRAGIDSLNVAAAAAVACYALAPRVAPRARVLVVVVLVVGRPEPRRDGPVGGIARREVVVLLAQLLAGPSREPVAEDGAVEVVGLVLQAAGEQPVAVDLDRVAVDVLPAADRRGRGGRASRTRPGRTGSPRRRRRGCGPCPPAARRPGCRPRRPDGPRRRRGSRRRRRRGRAPPGWPPGRRRRPPPSSRTCRAPGCAARRRTARPVGSSRASPGCPSG